MRQVERLIQGMSSKREPSPGRKPQEPSFDPNVAAATRELEAPSVPESASSPRIRTRGKIEIEYFTSRTIWIESTI